MNKILQSVFLFSMIVTSFLAHAQWEQMSNGGGGAFQDIHFDQNKPGRIWVCSDVDGIFTSDNWGDDDFVSRSNTSKHAFSFTVETRKGFDKIFSGTIYGAQVTTYGANNEPGEWSFIEESRGMPSGTIAISGPGVSGNNRVVVIAPAWHNKDGVIKKSGNTPEPFEPDGSREILISRDGGNSFASYSYETEQGYRQVYNAAVADDGTIYLGASAGVYVGNWNGSSYEFERKDNPLGIGASDGVTSTNKNAGCTGLSLSPDGTRIFASYHMGEEVIDPETGGTQRTFDVFSVKTSDLKNTSFARNKWVNISGGLRNNNVFDIAEFSPWHEPVINTWNSSGNSFELLLGIANNAGNNAARQGLWRGNISFTANGNGLVSQEWTKICDQNNNKVKDGAGSQEVEFDFDIGWEDRALIVRSYEVTPQVGGFNQQRIALTGGQNFFIGKNIRNGAASFPYSEDSWKAIYTKRVDDNPGDALDTYEDKGITNVVVYNVKQLGNYMVQATADNGIIESIDNGRSWNKNVGPIIPEEPGKRAGKSDNSSGVGILTFGNARNPILIADGRAGSFGIPKPENGTLFAYEFNSREITEFTKEEDWKKIGGGNRFSKPNDAGNRGLPGALLRSVVQATNTRERVYISLQGKKRVVKDPVTDELIRDEDGVPIVAPNSVRAGIYVTDNISSFIGSNTDWRKITPDTDAYDIEDYQELYADPVDDDVIWARGRKGGTSFIKGTRQPNGDYIFEAADFKVRAGLNGNDIVRNSTFVPDDLAVFLGPDGKTWGLASLSTSTREDTRVLINRNLAEDWNTSESWIDTGINTRVAIDTFTSVPTNWVDGFTSIGFATIAAVDNTIIVSLGAPQQRKGLGVFKGEIIPVENDSINIEWTDWTGNMFNTRFGEANITTDGNKTYLTAATRGMGVWRREIGGVDVPVDPDPPTNGAITHLKFTSKGALTAEKAPRIREIEWFDGATVFPGTKLTSGSGSVTASANQGNAYRVYDGILNGAWGISATEETEIILELENPINENPKGLDITVNARDRNLKGFVCWSSTDGVNFTKFYEISDLTLADYDGKSTTFTFGDLPPDPEPSAGFSHLRFVATGSVGELPRLKELTWFVDGEAYPKTKVTSETADRVTDNNNPSNNPFRIYDGLTNGGVPIDNFPQSFTVALEENTPSVPTSLEINVNAINRNFSGFECWGSSDGVTFEKFYEISGLTTDDYDAKATTFDLLSGNAIRANVSSLPEVGENAFSIFPNPSTSVVNFNRKVSVVIYNILGAKIKTYDAVDQIDVSQFRSGVYLIRSNDGQTSKLIVN